MAPQRTELVQVADPAALARRACERVLELAAQSIAERGAFRVALSGGSTPKLLYAELAERAAVANFSRWRVFFGDERCVPPEHADSNYRMANESWLGRGLVPATQIHRIRGELDPFEAASEYERELTADFGTREAPRFDLVLLGMGADGHTASLFPGSSALEETRCFVTSTWVEQLGAHRVTLTKRTINAARCVMFLVAGADKAQTLREVLHGAPDPRKRPAQLVQPWDGALIWLVDRAAAAGLGRVE